LIDGYVTAFLYPSYGCCSVARIERSEIRESSCSVSPDFATLYPGYIRENVIMLITFTTPVYADITMFGDVALNMLKLMGNSATVPGALLAEDIPEALQRLEAAVKADKQAPQPPAKGEDGENVAGRMNSTLQ